MISDQTVEIDSFCANSKNSQTTADMVYTVYTAERAESDGSEGAEGAERTEEGEVADGTDLAATYILLYGYNTMGLGYMSLWGAVLKIAVIVIFMLLLGCKIW